MKKISIITILDNTNFGTYLQAYALCQKLKNMGYYPELVDYCRPSLSFYSLLKLRVFSTYNVLKWPKRVYNLIMTYILRRKDKKFVESFLTAESYSSYKEIVKKAPVADVYMTGSDQVWNSFYNQGVDKAFFLAYAPLNAKKISYASSIGMSEIPKEEAAQMYDLLSDYSAISVREESAKNLLSSIGINRNEVTTVLDPSLLFDREKWNSFSKLKRLVNERYLLVYSVEKDKQSNVISSLAKRIAKEKKLKIVGVYYSGSNARIKCCDFDFFRATPDVFLSLFHFADFCVVSSFHGTAFSINFHKEFLTVAPNAFNSRVLHLLSVCNLKDRYVSDDNVDLNLIKTIDFDFVDSILDDERKKSEFFLRKAIDC